MCVAEADMSLYMKISGRSLLIGLGPLLNGLELGDCKKVAEKS